MSTVSGLIFLGDDNGAFAAVDARNGNPLWDFQVGAHWKASPMTYMSHGKQLIAVAAGGSIVVFGLPE